MNKGLYENAKNRLGNIFFEADESHSFCKDSGKWQKKLRY